MNSQELPPPTIQDAQAIPCSELDQEGEARGTRHRWVDDKQRPGFVYCMYCGLCAVDEP